MALDFRPYSDWIVVYPYPQSYGCIVIPDVKILEEAVDKAMRSVVIAVGSKVTCVKPGQDVYVAPVRCNSCEYQDDDTHENYNLLWCKEDGVLAVVEEEAQE